MADLQITIDDGPEPVKQVLDEMLLELGRRRVVAAFFVLGEEVHTSPEAAGRIVVQRHVLGNHSWNHFEGKSGTPSFSANEVIEQFERTHSEVLRATGVTMRHWRAPRLDDISRLTSLVTQSSASGGSRRPLYSLSHCDVHADSRDSQGVSSAGDMFAAIRSDIRAHSQRKVFRLLFHVKMSTANAFGRVLDLLVGDGHRFVDFEQRD